MRVTALTQGGIAALARGFVLAGNTCPMIDRVAQPNVRSVTHDDNLRLAAAPGDGSRAAQCPKRRIIPSAERPGTFREQRSQIDPPDTWHGSEDHDVLSLKTVSRCGFGRANLRADLIELTLSFPQLTVDNVQTRDQRAHVDACRFSNAIRDLYGRFSQCTDNGLGIDAADAQCRRCQG